MNDELINTILTAHANGATAAGLCDEYPEHAAAIQGLLQTVQALRAVAPPNPPARAQAAKADFLAAAAALRAKHALQAAAQGAPASNGRSVDRRGMAPTAAPTKATPRGGAAGRRPFWQRRLSWAVATALALILISGTVAASANAIPGDPLYFIKRWRETIELSLSSQDREISLRIDYCNERRRELDLLIGQHKEIPVSLIEDIQAETGLIEQQLSATGIQDPRWTKLAALTNDVQSTLTSVPADDPATAAAVSATQAQVSETHRRTEELLRQTQPPASNDGLPATTQTPFPTSVPALPINATEPTPTAQATATATSRAPIATPPPTRTATPPPASGPPADPQPTRAPVAPPADPQPTRAPAVPAAPPADTPRHTPVPAPPDIIQPTPAPTDTPKPTPGVPAIDNPEPSPTETPKPTDEPPGNGPPPDVPGPPEPTKDDPGHTPPGHDDDHQPPGHGGGDPSPPGQNGDPPPGHDDDHQPPGQNGDPPPGHSDGGTESSPGAIDSPPKDGQIDPTEPLPTQSDRNDQ